MQGYDRWLEQPYQDHYYHLDGLEEMTEQILEEPEFDPCNVDTFLNAIDDACLYAIKDKLAKLLQEEFDPVRGWRELGTDIYEAVYRYCQSAAEREAIKRYNDGLEGQERD